MQRIPWSMRPGPGDDDLESRLIWRWYAWGGAATIFMALFLPALLIHEPARISLEERRFRESSIARGAALFGPVGLTAVNCARCHGPAGEGGVQPIRIGTATTTMAEPPLAYLVARYKAAGRSDEDVRQLVRDAIERGRAGTPMPTWGLPFGGPLNSQQVDDLLSFLLAPAPPEGSGVAPGERGYGLQKEPPGAGTLDGAKIFAQNCSLCHGPGADGRDLAGNQSPGPNLTVALQRNTIQEIHDTVFFGRLNTSRVSMPSWAYLGKDAIQALVRFIESIQRGGR
ncbi:MAG: c-type cytochrome [Acidobacteria bacterium]|nr:c-type cytochrome [Acidobacteriota bacterium]